MGVSLQCKKTKNDLDLGYGSFRSFRIKIAKLCNKEFGDTYEYILDNSLRYLSSEPNADLAYGKIDKLVEDKSVSRKVVDFCFQSDCAGRIHYGACKEILKHIAECTDKDTYGYCSRAFTMHDFAGLLQECVDNKCDLIWD